MIAWLGRGWGTLLPSLGAGKHSGRHFKTSLINHGPWPCHDGLNAENTLAENIFDGKAANYLESREII